MSRHVLHDGQRSLQVRFGFDRRLVDRIKSLPRRRWVASERFWSVPDDDVVVLVETLHAEAFGFCEATQRLYRARGGQLPLETGSATVLEEDDAQTRSPDRAGDYTVSRLNQEVRAVLQDAFPRPVWITGEMAGFTKNAHRRVVTFELLERDPGGDTRSELCATLFEDTKALIERRLAQAGDPFRLEDEITVRLLGRVELYVPWGSFRLVVEDIDVDFTLGEAARRREEILRRLLAEGIAGANLALPFPDLPLRVGVVTSLGSDACADVLRTLEESGFAFDVTVHGARVQGRLTEPSVLDALAWFRARREQFDVVMVCRGGGSRTDLAWFDTDALARAVATFPLPVLVGIGHEQDRSVLDAVGRRCKTPTAAAALLVSAVSRAIEGLDGRLASVLSLSSRLLGDERHAAAGRAARLVRATRGRIDGALRELAHASARAGRASRGLLAVARGDLVRRSRGLPTCALRLVERRRSTLEAAVRQVLQGARRDLAGAASRLARHGASARPLALRALAIETERSAARAQRLALLDPRRVLGRGYAILRQPGGPAITSPAHAPAGAGLVAELRDGRLAVRSEGPHEE